MKTIRNLFVLLSVVALLGACGSKEKEESAPPPAAQPTPNEPEERFKIRLENDSFGIEYEKQKPGS